MKHHGFGQAVVPSNQQRYRLPMVMDKNKLAYFAKAQAVRFNMLTTAGALSGLGAAGEWGTKVDLSKANGGCAPGFKPGVASSAGNRYCNPDPLYRSPSKLREEDDGMEDFTTEIPLVDAPPGPTGSSILDWILPSFGKSAGAATVSGKPDDLPSKFVWGGLGALGLAGLIYGASKKNTGIVLAALAASAVGVVGVSGVFSESKVA